MSSPSVTCCAVLGKGGWHTVNVLQHLHAKLESAFPVAAFKFCGTHSMCLMSSYLAGST